MLYLLLTANRSSRKRTLLFLLCSMISLRQAATSRWLTTIIARATITERHEMFDGSVRHSTCKPRQAFVEIWRPSSVFHFHSSARFNGNKGLRAKKAKRKKDTEELFRADRVLSQRSDMSRSECFELLKKKRVWQKIARINGREHGDVDFDWVAVAGPSIRMPMGTPLWIDRTHTVPLPPPLLAAYHKPKWVLSVTKDPLERPCLDETIVPKGMHPVGRLDYDSSGLMLFSSSGPLTQRLLHPKHEISKIYEVVVTDRVDKEKLGEKLAQGVKTGDGIHKAKLLSVDHFPDHEVVPYLAKIRSKIPSHYNQTDLQERGYLDVFQATSLSTVLLQVSEGKYRMVRRIMANCGHPVVSLVRRQFGNIGLHDLPEGSLRPATDDEIAWATSLVSVDASTASR